MWGSKRHTPNCKLTTDYVNQGIFTTCNCGAGNQAAFPEGTRDLRASIVASRARTM